MDDEPTGGRHHGAHALAVALAALAVLTQVSYPLLAGTPLRGATIGAVLLFATASLSHAAATRGPAAAVIVLAAAGGLGLLAEMIGVRTGVPFGRYGYTGTLGPEVAGVPLVVPLAWVMTAYPCVLLGRRLGAHVTASGGSGVRGRPATWLTGGVTLAAWDLYLDPQMVAAGHWTWADPVPALPGVPGVPLSNYAGWLLVSVVMIALLDAVLPGTRAPLPAEDETVPAALLTWTWLGSALANLAFFGRPAVACYGAVAMGATTVPYLRLLATHRCARAVTGTASAPGPTTRTATGISTGITTGGPR